MTMRVVLALALAAALLATGIVIGAGLRRDPPQAEAKAPSIVAPQPTSLPSSVPVVTAAKPDDVAAAVGSDDIPAAFARLGLKEDMDYAAAKAGLASGGYLPAPLEERDCASIGEADCAAFPEIEACSGTGAGFCSARYAGRDGTHYNVITQGPGGPLVRVFAAIVD